MKNVDLKTKLRYAFDNTMSKGTIALIVWLGIVSTLVILIGAVLLLLFKQGPPEIKGNLGFIEAFWINAMHAMDAGNVAGDEGWGFRLIGLFVTIGGIFVVGIFIGVVTSGIEAKIEELRKGRSFVVEQEHTLILGWSPKIFTIIAEICIANENQKKPRIVVMAEMDKVEMEDEIREKVSDTKNTKVICRTGIPSEFRDLEMVNIQETKSVILLAEETDNSDGMIIKNILAITRGQNRRETPYHIVAELHEEKNIKVAEMVAKDELEIIQPGDMIARIMVQTCLQVGLSLVYNEILGYEGDEIYFQEEPTLVGKTFVEALHAYEDSTVIGLRKADGKVMICPPMDTKIMAGDSVCAISEDDDTVIVSGKTGFDIDLSLIREEKPEVAKPQKILVLGWNRYGIRVLRGLNRYLVSGSELVLVTSTDLHLPDPETFNATLDSVDLKVIMGDTTDREILETLDIPAFDNVMVLSYRDVLTDQEADSKTLLSLLHLRDIAEKHSRQFSIVTEMLDIANRELAQVTRADDYIVGENIVSLILAQISEEKGLSDVFHELFDSDGCEIFLNPLEKYAATGVPLNFHVLTEAAAQRGEVAIGYRIMAQAHDSDKNFGLVVNPDKSNLVSFEKGDYIIVVAED